MTDLKTPFAETDLGKFLAGKGFDSIIQTVGSFIPGASMPVEMALSLKDSIMKQPAYASLSDDDKNTINALHGQMISDIQAAQQEDTANARAREVSITGTLKKRDWLLALLALFGVAAPIAIIAIIQFTGAKVDVLVAGFIGVIVGNYSTIYQYFFGSSSGSKDKDETIKNIANQ